MVNYTGYNVNNYTVTIIYDETWGKYRAEVTDNEGNNCELWFNSDYDKFYIQYMKFISGKHMRRVINGGLTASRTRLSNKEYEVLRLFNKYVTDNSRKIFELLNE